MTVEDIHTLLTIAGTVLGAAVFLLGLIFVKVSDFAALRERVVKLEAEMKVLHAKS